MLGSSNLRPRYTLNMMASSIQEVLQSLDERDLICIALLYRRANCQNEGTKMLVDTSYLEEKGATQRISSLDG